VRHCKVSTSGHTGTRTLCTQEEGSQQLARASPRLLGLGVLRCSGRAKGLGGLVLAGGARVVKRCGGRLRSGAEEDCKSARVRVPPVLCLTLVSTAASSISPALSTVYSTCTTTPRAALTEPLASLVHARSNAGADTGTYVKNTVFCRPRASTCSPPFASDKFTFSTAKAVAVAEAPPPPSSACTADRNPSKSPPFSMASCSCSASPRDSAALKRMITQQQPAAAEKRCSAAARAASTTMDLAAMK
jgi:hypothetical protein